MTQYHPVPIILPRLLMSTWFSRFCLYSQTHTLGFGNTTVAKQNKTKHHNKFLEKQPEFIQDYRYWTYYKIIYSLFPTFWFPQTIQNTHFCFLNYCVGQLLPMPSQSDNELWVSVLTRQGWQEAMARLYGWHHQFFNNAMAVIGNN